MSKCDVSVVDIGCAAAVFTEAFVENMETGYLMMGEALSMLHYDPDMDESAVEEAVRLIESFLKNEGNHAKEDIREIGEELLGIYAREGEAFFWNGRNLLVNEM